MEYSFYFWIEVITLFVCLYCYRNFNAVRYKLFLPYLAFIVLFEFGSIHNWFSIHKSNLWSVNIEITIEFVFYSFFILSGYKNLRQRRAVTWLIISAVLFTLTDIFFLQGIMVLCTIAILVQYSVLIALVCMFFYRKMHEFDANTSLLQQPDFWVYTGLLFFFLSEFLFFASFTTMAYKKINNFHLLFTVISNVAILILYSCLSISFLCFRRMKKLSY